MRAAISQAEVGDDVLGDDPTILRLETMAAEMLGKEAAIFAASGTQSNLMALMSHCQRGDEYIVGQQAHTYRWEGGGAAVLGSIQPQPLDFEPDGSIDLDKAKAAIKSLDDHHPRTRLFCLENTQGGKVLPMAYLEKAKVFADLNGLATHLDGARVFNAVVALDLPVAAIAGPFDSVSVCLSKGLGAPIGSVLCGSRDLIRKAHRWRKVLGGGMRQAGIIAAAGIYALENNISRLADDHANAEALAVGLGELDEIDLPAPPCHTNMMFAALNKRDGEQLKDFLATRGITILASDAATRLVTHMDVTEDDIKTVVEAFKDHYS